MAGKSIKKNYIYNLIYQILLLVTPIVTAPYLSRILKADGIGTISYVESVVSYFVLFATLGITVFGQREISYVQDIKEKRSKIFWQTLLLQIITGGLVLAVYIPFALLQNNRVLYLIFIMNIISVPVNITWFFQGIEEFGLIVFRNIIVKLLNISFIFMFVRTRNDLSVYVFGGSFFTFMANLSLWLYLPKFVEKPDWKEIKPLRNLKTVISLFVPTVAVQIYTVMDKTMIGLITQSTAENGYYEQAVKISKLVLTAVTALGTVMVPRIGLYFGKGEFEKVRAYMYRGYRFVWFLGCPLCFGLIGVSANFVPWFFGEGYEKVPPLLCILSFLILAIGINNVTGVQYLIPTKRESLLTRTVFVGAFVNLILNAVLIKYFQSFGAAVASVAAETTIAAVQLYFVRKELSLKTILGSGWHYILSAGVMLVLLLWAGRLLSPSIINTAIMVAAGAVVYFVILLLMKDEFFLQNARSVLSKGERTLNSGGF